MSLTPEQVAAALAGQREPGESPEVKAAKRRAQTRAQADARQALVVLHRDEYRLLYDAALAKRLEQEGL